MNNILSNISSKFRRLISSSQQTDIISGLVEPLVRKVNIELTLPEDKETSAGALVKLLLHNPYVVSHQTPRVNLSANVAAIEVEIIGDHKEELIKYLDKQINAG